MSVPYQEGMAVYIREGVALDAWGREVQGYDVEASERAAQAAHEEAQRQANLPQGALTVTVNKPTALAPEQDDDRDDDEYDTMSADELKEELKRRQEAGREIDTTGVRRKAQLAEVLREDDRKQAQES